MNDLSTGTEAPRTDVTMARVIYILYLVAIVAGITAIVGVIMAYVQRANAGVMLTSHYTWQIRTFWIGLLGSVVGSITVPIGIGFLVLLAVLVWWIVRCVKGMQWLERRENVPDTQNWLFG